ncbi:TetR/AcrR family transcriptional regulator [Haliea sp. E17]|uniref:TetR/AcrR family transcriptional regulator n=1 Tax=Haliea sp. E17 TaxID=3401576 RepID=UPI003AAC2907
MTRQKLHQPHYATATDPRILQTRQALRDALLSLVGKKPLEQITIREIAAAAGIGYNTFFRHYTDKEALLRAIVTDELAQLIELCITTLDTTDSAQASIALCEFVAEHEALWSTLLTGGGANLLREEFMRQLRENAPSRISASATSPVEVGVRLVATGTLEILGWWLEQPQRLPVAQVAAIYEQLVVAPVVGAYMQ